MHERLVATNQKLDVWRMKALLSSGAMYGGFVTLDQRRQLVEMGQEIERAKLVTALKETIKEKDQLMSVSSCLHLANEGAPTL